MIQAYFDKNSYVSVYNETFLDLKSIVEKKKRSRTVFLSCDPARIVSAIKLGMCVVPIQKMTLNQDTIDK